MTAYLLDNSVLQRLDRSEPVRVAVERLMGRGDLLASSDVSLLEAGYSAVTAADHARIMHALGTVFLRLPLSEEVGRVAFDLQSALFASSIGRAAGVIDLLHAATAICHGAVIVHYDADFEVLASVDPRLRQHWIVPAGSVD